MKVVLVNQFYPPDAAPTGRYLHDVGRALAGRGHDVVALCSRGVYAGNGGYPRRENLDGVSVWRLSGPGLGRRVSACRVATDAWFGTRAALRLGTMRPRPDLIVALTSPPFIGFGTRWAARLRGCRHAQWVMDLYPDALQAHGVLAENTRRYHFLGRLTRTTLRDSICTFTLSPEMAERVDRYASSGAVRWVPLWSQMDGMTWESADAVPWRAEHGWGRGELVLMYSGNMGLAHRFDEILAAARALQTDASVRWVFAGAGRRRSEIERFRDQCPDARVELLDYAPPERLAEHLAAADVHLVSLDSAWQGVLLPSKVQNIFGVGRPVIFVGGEENSIARWIREAGAGWVVHEGDPDGLLRAVEEARDPAARQRKGLAARQYAQRAFGQERNCSRIVAWLEETCAADRKEDPLRSARPEKRPRHLAGSRW